MCLISQLCKLEQNRYHVEGFVLLSVLFLMGCNRADRKDIGSDVFVVVQKGGDDVEIVCVTEKQYGCSNYVVRYNLRQVNDTRIRAKLKDVVVPDACLTSIGPAYCTIVSQGLAPGSYPITFELNGQKTEGTLTVSATNAELVLDEGGNVKLL